MELGYDMFLDREKLKDPGIQFIEDDIFDDASPLAGLEGNIDFRIARLLKPGGILVDRQAGCVNATLLTRNDGKVEMFWHNPESFKKMWGAVSGEWKVESSLEEWVDLSHTPTNSKIGQWIGPNRGY
ncbi:hypothetical protein RUND412_007578 [Rhizina undulata]